MLQKIRESARFKTGKGFTLVELLVVIGIIGLLAGLVLPAVRNAQVRAKKMKCAAHLRDIGQALQMWSMDHLEQLPTTSVGGKVADVMKQLYPGAGSSAVGRYIDDPVVFECPLVHNSDYKRYDGSSSLDSDNICYGYYLGDDPQNGIRLTLNDKTKVIMMDKDWNGDGEFDVNDNHKQDDANVLLVGGAVKLMSTKKTNGNWLQAIQDEYDENNKLANWVW